MANEMIDRVARVLFPAYYYEDGSKELEHPGNEFGRIVAEHSARAAIAAMREPTDAMVMAITPLHSPALNERVKEDWRTMIDAALKETDDAKPNA